VQNFEVNATWARDIKIARLDHSFMRGMTHVTGIIVMDKPLIQ